jgi:hypothetical protein
MENARSNGKKVDFMLTRIVASYAGIVKKLSSSATISSSLEI